MTAGRVVPAIALTVLLGVGGCGAGAPPAAGSAAPVSTSAAPAQASSAAGSPSAGRTAGGGAGARYVFPVAGRASYARTHHDYPAADIIAPCGTAVVSPVDGTVLEVTRVDAWDPAVDAGATRGGLSVAVLGVDGARYYGSHYARIEDRVEPGVRVAAGEQLGTVGRTGHAGACHLHFGLSPACGRTGDWWIRRGVVPPWPYLDAWRAGAAKSPVQEVSGWQARHGCPARPPSTG